MPRNPLTVFITIFISLLLLGGAAFWYFVIYTPVTAIDQIPDPEEETGGFSPFGRTPAGNTTPNTKNPATTTPATVSTTKIPTLRLLSDTPVGGYGASTTPNIPAVASTTKQKGQPAVIGTTVVRWIDRGRGNIYEARADTLNIQTLSNTLVPRVYESVWNKNLTAFISTSLDENGSTPLTFYTELRPQTQIKASSTINQQSVAPFELKGKPLPGRVVAFAVSPKKDRVFIYSIENGQGIGYTAPFNGGTATQIFSSPITQVNVEWPSDNIIAVTTAGGASQNGFLYFINPATGVWKKALGPTKGLSTRVSHDGAYIFASGTGTNNSVVSTILSTKDNSRIDPLIKTLADKCAWGNFYKNLIYCAVPSQAISGTYPDDWYKGSISSIDKIWKVNATTGEVTIVSSIIDQSDRTIDAFNLTTDDRDEYLFFMNKRDLSLWSLDLVASD